MSSLRRVLLPQPIEPEAVTMLEEAGCEIVQSPDPTLEAVVPLMGDVQGLILRTGIRITRELLSHAGDLRIISRTGAGLDNVDVEAATERDIIVTSNVGVNTSSVVEHVVALMLAMSKQLPLMDRAVRRHNFGIRYKNLPRDIRGRTMGLMGFGRIGSEVGRVCHEMFGMEILAFDPLLPAEARRRWEGWVAFVEMEALFSRSDVISIHVPLTEGTRHAVGVREIGWMKPEALLINTSRGAVIDEAALIDALWQGRVGGAGLDVFETEPVPEESPLLNLENVILTPHSAALTRECVARMATEAARCVIDLFNGMEPPYVANPQVLTSARWRDLISGKGGPES